MIWDSFKVNAISLQEFTAISNQVLDAAGKGGSTGNAGSSVDISSCKDCGQISEDLAKVVGGVQGVDFVELTKTILGF